MQARAGIPSHGTPLSIIDCAVSPYELTMQAFSSILALSQTYLSETIQMHVVVSLGVECYSAAVY